MAKVYYTQKAVEDLASIWNYTFEEWSEMQADRYYEELVANCELLVKRPKLGKSANAIRINLLSYHVGRHFVFFQRISKTEIEIVRILHDSMDFQIHF